MIDTKQQLKLRIERQFSKVKLIGDILISDQEYETLINFLKVRALHYVNNEQLEIDPVYAVALVQLGIHAYDGSFWPHMKKVMGFSQLTPVQQHNLSVPFLHTLRHYNHRIIQSTDSENVSNITMHGFVSNHYVKNLFDFLYRFYQRDLLRNIEPWNLNKALNLLVEMIQTDEHWQYDQSNRSYMLVVQTKNAIKHLPKRSVIMRFKWLLKTIDRIWFQEDLTDSKSRIIQEFRKWYESSDMKRDIRSARTGERTRSGNMVASAYIEYRQNMDSKPFYLVIPNQSFIARKTDILKMEIQFGDEVFEKNPGQFEDQLFYRTQPLTIGIDLADLFKPLRVVFKIRDKVIRELVVSDGKDALFFDSRLRSTRFAAGKQIVLDGQMYMFAKQEATLQFSGEYGRTAFGNYVHYDFMMSPYDYVILNHRDFYTARAIVEEGLSQRGLVSYAFVEETPIYNLVPIVFFKSTRDRMTGTVVTIGGKRIRLESMNPMIFESFQDGSIQVILSLDQNDVTIGVNEIIIDIPGYQPRNFFFAYLPGLEFTFENGPFIFVSEGFIAFTNKSLVHGDYDENDGVYQFSISGEDILRFTYQKSIEFLVKPPVFSWSFNNVDYTTGALDDIWYQQFPQSIDYLFDEKVLIEIDNGTESTREVESEFRNGMNVLDLTLARTMFSNATVKSVEVSVVFNGKKYRFAKVITATTITNVSALSYDEVTHSMFGQYDRIGEDKLYLTMVHTKTQKVLCEHLLIERDSFRINTKDVNGEYELIFSIRRGRFGSVSYESIYQTTRTLVTNNLSGIVFKINGFYLGTEKIEVRRFKYPQIIEDVVKIGPDTYKGVLRHLSNTFREHALVPVWRIVGDIEIQIKGTDRVGWIVELFIQEDEDGDVELLPLLYDRYNRELVAEEDKSVQKRAKYARYEDLTDRNFELAIYSE